MKTRAPLLFSQAILVALSLACTSTARATPDFPAVVVRSLDLPGITIDPPQGCELCHTTDSGGTSLRPFGTILQQYGAQPYQENTLEAALGQVAQNEPQLVDDIKASKDPNDDTGASTTVHTPSYGCGATVAPMRASLAPSCSATMLVAALAALGLRRSRGRTRRRRAGSAQARR